MKKGFIQLVRKRRSIRSYKSEPVPRDLLKRCIEAARFAPSTCNTQAWRFIITSHKLKERLARESLGGVVVPNKFASQAPVLVVIAMDLDLITHRIGGTLKGMYYHVLDAGIAGEHFILQATELGLGTCWIGWFNSGRVRRILNLPRSWDVAAMITVGYPDEEPSSKGRKTIGEISEFRTE
jgi:nitroreductase